MATVISETSAGLVRADARSQAAILLLEALLLTLLERGTLREDEVDGVFEDALAAHAARGASQPSAVSQLVHRILHRMQAKGHSTGEDP